MLSVVTLPSWGFNQPFLWEPLARLASFGYGFKTTRWWDFKLVWKLVLTGNLTVSWTRRVSVNPAKNVWTCSIITAALSSASSEGKQCRHFALTELLQHCQGSFHFSSPIFHFLSPCRNTHTHTQTTSTFTPHRYAVTRIHTHTNTHSPHTASSWNVPDVLATQSWQIVYIGMS